MRHVFCVVGCAGCAKMVVNNKKEAAMGRRIVITSGKGGVGKTTLVAGLGRALAGMGYSVCLVDADFGLNNLDIVMEAEDKVVYDLADCMQGKCRIQQALISDTSQEGLFLLAAGKLPCGVVVDFNTIVAKISSIFDFVLVDCPAGQDEGFSRAVKACGEAILVTTAHPSAMRDASRIAGLVFAAIGESPELVINRQRGDLVAGGQMLDYKAIGKLLNLQVLGVLPECDNYNITSSVTKTRNSGSRLWIALQMTAQNLVDCTNTVYDCTSGYTGLIGAIKRKLKNI